MSATGIEKAEARTPVPARLRVMPGRIVLLLIVLSASCALPAGAETIRVAVADDQRSVVLKSSSGFLPGTGVSGPVRLSYAPQDVGSRPVRVVPAGPFIIVNGKSYRGLAELRKKPNGLLQVINELNIEDYLMGVVAAEIPHDWEFEAIKAQAVAARTYALHQKGMAGSRPYHIQATVNSQVYSGKSGERETAVRAVRETEGIVITHKGAVIAAFFHSSCGGHTEDASELWGIYAPYLRGVDCECQRISRYGLWEKRLSPGQIAASLGRLGYRLDGIRELSIDGITPAGRVKQVAIRHAGGVTLVPAEKFRGAIGYSAVPSVFFEIELSGSEVVISGRGLGHGVGLCQWGAREMAQLGHDYKAILAHYYPGTRLVKRETGKP